MTGGRERRRAPRARFSGIVLVRAEGFEISCVAGDISPDGMLLYPTRPSPVLPTHLRLTFALPDSPHWLEAEGELVRQHMRSRRAVWAVRFTGMEEATRAALQRFSGQTGERRPPSPMAPPAQQRDVPPAERGGRHRRAVQTPSGKLELSGLPAGPVEERSSVVSIEAELPDPETVTLSSDEVHQLAAASVLDPEPPLASDDDAHSDASTQVRGADPTAIGEAAAPKPKPG